MGLNKRLISTAAAGGVVNTENFAPVLYTGNGSTQSINVGFAADLVFIKNRTVGQGWSVWDTVRGASSGYLETQVTSAEAAQNNMLTFDSEGFNVSTNGGGYTQTNRSSSGDQYVSFSWKAGGAAVSNTDGTITAQVSANVDSGFSIVKYTGTSTTATVGHGLSSAPEVVIIKALDRSSSWAFYTTAVDGLYDYIYFNQAVAKVDSAISAPTSTLFNVNNTEGMGTNYLTGDYIAYCFHSVDGYQKVGTYTSAYPSTTSVNVGFQPRFVMIKSYNQARNWVIHDSARTDDKQLYPNLANAEGDTSTQLQFTSTGFDVSGGSNDLDGGSSYSYIYLAIA